MKTYFQRFPSDVLFALAFTISLVGCSERPASNLPTTNLAIGSKTFTLEIAAGGAARTRGLMMRDSMPDDHGMVFCFAEERVLSFWMSNTRIPLDIIYLDGTGRIVSIHQMQPYVESSVGSDHPARFAIELNQGMAAKTGVKAGDTLNLPGAITAANADP